MMTEDDIQQVIYGTLGTIAFMCFFMLLLFAPLLGVFLFVWVLTTNALIAGVLGLIAEAIYLYFWVVG